LRPGANQSSRLNRPGPVDSHSLKVGVPDRHGKAAGCAGDFGNPEVDRFFEEAFVHGSLASEGKRASKKSSGRGLNGSAPVDRGANTFENEGITDLIAAEKHPQREKSKKRPKMAFNQRFAR
jgi:hypothetical protein